MRDAYRIHEAPPECVEIGSVFAEDSASPIDDIASTAARHGGTHYIVRGDKTSITGWTGVVIGPIVSVDPVPETSRRMWARVYRCPT